MEEKRNAWQGILSLLAFIALSVEYSFESLWSGMSIGTRAWAFCNIISACTQWAIPAMVAMVGSIFLSSKHPVKVRYLWKQYVSSTAVSCVVWWTLSAVVWMQNNYPQELDWITFRECMAEVLESPANIGFCQMLVSFFILYPLLHAIARNRQLTAYGMILIYAMSLIEPVFRYIPHLAAVSLFTDQLNWGYYRAWTFYLLCGVWIANYEHSWKTSLLIYSLGILASGAMIALTSAATVFQPGYANEYIGYASPLTGIQTVSVCLFVQRAFGGVRFPKLTIITKNLWHCVPILFITSFFTERLTEYFQFSDFGNAFCNACLNAIAAFFLIHALGLLPGFKRLVGDYTRKGDGIK